MDQDDRITASRYRVRSPIDAMGGPFIGLLADTQKVFGIFDKLRRDEDLTEGDVGAAFRLLPGRSFPGVRSVLEYEVIPEAKRAVQ